MWMPSLQFECPTAKGWGAGAVQSAMWTWRSSAVIEKADTSLWQEMWKNLVVLTSFSDVSQILEL